MSQQGKVYLVGAGPGDPLLLTLRAVECLAEADLVLYDYLVDPQILEHASPSAQTECLGRHGQGRIVSQEEINQRLLREARLGKTVVRLKGGDPAVFARGAEEVETLLDAGIQFEIVPGITAALAAGSYAGVSITHRDEASGVALVAGQECPEKSASGLDYDGLSRFPGTLVFYMGVTTAPRWSETLIEAGKPPETPVALIRRCSWPNQQTFTCSLGEVAQLISEEKIRPPAIVIVGQVARRRPATWWFESRPLFGQTVLVTRPLEQSRVLRNRLRTLGAKVLVQPAIEISEPADTAPLDEAIARLSDFDWLVFSSANGVRYFVDRLLRQGHDLRHFGGVKIATIGPATSEALAAYHLRADLEPEEYRAESLAEALAGDARDKRFLLARASRGREILEQELTAAGGLVQQVVVYQSTDVDSPDPEIIEALADGQIDWTTVTSSAIARSLVSLFGESLQKTKLASISPLTSGVLQEAGFEPTIEAEVYTTEGLVKAMLAYRS